MISELQIKVNICEKDNAYYIRGDPMLYPNIRALREDNDLRQRQPAELLNVSQNTYSQYDTGVIALTA